MAHAVITVEADGAVASWSPEDGFFGDTAIAGIAREAARGNYEIEWGLVPDLLVADSETKVGALTALMYYKPARTRVLDWPDDLRAWWLEHAHLCDPGLGES